MMLVVPHLVLQLVMVKVVCTTHFSYQKFDCWLDGGDYVLSLSSYYPSTIKPNKDRPSFSLYLSMDDKFSTYGDGRGGVDNRTTHSSSQKFYLGTYMYDVFLDTSESSRSI